MKDEELLKFRIDQLRKDKMIYALESIALTFIVELTYILLTVLLNKPYSSGISLAALIIPLAYYLFMAVGNILRYREIRELEKRLYGK